MTNLCHFMTKLKTQMFASLKNRTTYHTSGEDWHWETLISHGRGAFVSHFLSFHSPLSNGNNWFFFRKWKTLVIKHFVSKSEFQDCHQDWRKIGNSLKLKERNRSRRDMKRRGREWNNEWSPSELSFPGRAPQGMQTLSHQKWATYLWKEWLLHPIWFGSPIIS